VLACLSLRPLLLTVCLLRPPPDWRPPQLGSSLDGFGLRDTSSRIPICIHRPLSLWLARSTSLRCVELASNSSRF